MKVTVLSPSMSNLQKLRKKYPADKNNPFEHIESESISEAKAGYSGDTDPPCPVILTPHRNDGSMNLNG
jgi:hypothetical protein